MPRDPHDDGDTRVALVRVDDFIPAKGNDQSEERWNQPRPLLVHLPKMITAGASGMLCSGLIARQQEAPAIVFIAVVSQRHVLRTHWPSRYTRSG